MAGQVCACNNFEIELYELSTRERESICNKVKDTPSETDDAVWGKTLEEVEKGWLLGPFNPQQIPSHYPLSRRYALHVDPTLI